MFGSNAEAGVVACDEDGGVSTLTIMTKMVKTGVCFRL